MKVLLVGADSAVGLALQGLLAERKLDFKAYSTHDLDLLQKMSVAKAVSLYAPTQVINVAGYTNLELAERDVEAARLCDEQNSLIPAVLAEVCSHLSLPLIQHSSSFVFDGTRIHPYGEDDQANPVCRYGRSKWYGERSIRDVLASHIILRTDWVISDSDAPYFQRLIDLCKSQQGKLDVMNNRFSPTPAADVARVLLGITLQLDCAADVWGTYHYCAQQPLTQEIFVEQFLLEAARYDEALAAALKTLRIGKLPVQVPYIANTVLNCQKLFETFGIKPRARNTELTALVRRLYRQEEATPPIVAAVAQDSSTASAPVKRRPRSVRRPSKKAGRQREK